MTEALLIIKALAGLHLLAAEALLTAAFVVAAGIALAALALCLAFGLALGLILLCRLFRHPAPKPQETAR